LPQRHITGQVHGQHINAQLGEDPEAAANGPSCFHAALASRKCGTRWDRTPIDPNQCPVPGSLAR
jgi:hypothetical protein